MAWIDLFTAYTDQYNGSVDTFEQFLSLKEAFEESTNTYFIESRSTKDFKTTEITDEYVKGAHYYCCDPQASKTKGPLLHFGGHPMTLRGNMQLDCRFGPNRHQKRLDRERRKKEENLLSDHPVPSGKKVRKRFQETMKHGCQAKIRLRDVIYLKEVVIPENASKRKAAEIRKSYLTSTEHPVIERKILVSLPTLDDHDLPHLMGESERRSSNVLLSSYKKGIHCQDASLVAPISKDLLARLQQLAHEGVTNVDEMKRHLDNYVERELCCGRIVSKSNRHYFPSKMDIENHMRLFRTRSRLTHDDQDNVNLLVEKWKNEKTADSFFYRRNRSAGTAGTEDGQEQAQSFLFVHQTVHQKYLLEKYGNSLSLLDATYKTSKYDLPLFLLSVCTNVGYSVVATFIVESETTVNIKEALTMIKEWNVNWQPEYFLVDFDSKEISAIETIFHECVVLICKFHRERAWDRWLSNQTHNMHVFKDDALTMLRTVANSRTEEEYNTTVESLLSSEIFNNNTQFQKYIVNTWLPHHTKWVDAYRNTRIQNYINTTNGVESKFKELKYFYLDSYSDNTIHGLVSTVVNKFIPDLETRYHLANVKGSSLYRQYSRDIPVYLHNIPKPILEHCISKLDTDINLERIECIIAEKKYNVPSETGEGMYCIDFEVPECTCPAWAEKHLPCKHMLAVLSVTDGKWTCFPRLYRDSPIFHLDSRIVTTMQPNNSLHVEQEINISDCNIATTEATDSDNVISQNSPLETVNEPDIHSDSDNVINENLPDIHQRNTSVTADSLRAKCSHLQGHITNLMFMTNDVVLLRELKNKLENCLSTLNESVPSYGGLHVIPQRRTLKNSKKKKRRRILSKKRRVNNPLLKKKACHTKGSRSKHKTTLQNRVHGLSSQTIFLKESYSNSNLEEISVSQQAEVQCVRNLHGFKGPYTGIKNGRNCCWFNSSMQALKQIVDENELQTAIANSNRPEAELLVFLAKLQHNSERLYDPETCLDRIETLSNGSLIKGRQHDAHEFICFFLGCLTEIQLISQVELTTQFMCIENHHIHSVLPHHIQRCSHISLAVDVEDVRFCSIHDCMLQTVISEDIWPNVMLGDNAVYCRQCEKRCDTVERCILSSCSKHLIIHLKRFRNDGSKITRPLTIDRILDLQSGQYSLQAVQCHYGNRLHSGHYYSVCIKDDGAYNCDDGNIFFHRDADQFLTQSDIEEQCYILYYTRDHVDRPIYCICKQPWNSRFMIECELCKEWYHGSCVNITEAKGRKIQQWHCSKCIREKPHQQTNDYTHIKKKPTYKKRHQQTNEYTQIKKKPRICSKSSPKKKTVRGRALREALKRTVYSCETDEQEVLTRDYKRTMTFEMIKESLEQPNVQEVDFKPELEKTVPLLKKICILDKSIPDKSREAILTFCTKWKGRASERKYKFGEKLMNAVHLQVICHDVMEMAIAERKEKSRLYGLWEPFFKWDVCRELQDKFEVSNNYMLDFVQDVLAKEAIVEYLYARHQMTRDEVLEICKSTEISLH